MTNPNAVPEQPPALNRFTSFWSTAKDEVCQKKVKVSVLCWQRSNCFERYQCAQSRVCNSALCAAHASRAHAASQESRRQIVLAIWWYRVSWSLANSRAIVLALAPRLPAPISWLGSMNRSSLGATRGAIRAPPGAPVHARDRSFVIRPRRAPHPSDQQWDTPAEKGGKRRGVAGWPSLQSNLKRLRSVRKGTVVVRRGGEFRVRALQHGRKALASCGIHELDQEGMG